MSDQNVFGTNENSQETPEQKPTNANNLFADQLSKIVNESGEPKYKTVEDALEGNAHAQKYITELKQKLEATETEKSTIQQELEKRKSVEEALERLTAPKEKPQEAPPTQAQGIDGETLTKTVEELLNQREQASTQKSNLDKVQSALINKYGNKASEEITNKAKELGLTNQEFEVMAKEKPALVLQLFGTTPASSSPTSGGQRVPNEYAPKSDEVPSPAKSLLRGATSKERQEYMKLIRDNVYRKNGVTT